MLIKKIDGYYWAQIGDIVRVEKTRTEAFTALIRSLCILTPA